MEGKHIRFTQLLETHLNSAIQKEFNGRPELTTNVLREVRDTLKEKITSVFTRSQKHKLTPDSIGWLTNQYFKSIKVADDVHVSDLIVINEYSLSDLPYHDIEMLHNLYSDSKAPWVTELREEFKKRMTS